MGMGVGLLVPSGAYDAFRRIIMDEIEREGASDAFISQSLKATVV